MFWNWHTKTSIDHEALSYLLEPIHRLYADVKRKALMRLSYEGDTVPTDPDEAINYAIGKYAYYVCSGCDKAYYGGDVRCEVDDNDCFDRAELVCGACSDISKAQMCAKHGTDFLEYKCRYCCSVAVFFCFGTTHFCSACHDDFQRITSIPQNELPQCPAGVCNYVLTYFFKMVAGFCLNFVLETSQNELKNCFASVDNNF